MTFIAADNPAVAESFGFRLMSKMDALNFPQLGRVVPEEKTRIFARSFFHLTELFTRCYLRNGWLPLRVSGMARGVNRKFRIVGSINFHAVAKLSSNTLDLFVGDSVSVAVCKDSRGRERAGIDGIRANPPVPVENAPKGELACLRWTAWARR